MKRRPASNINTSQLFDANAEKYESEVDKSIAFTGLSLDLFTRSKQALIATKADDFRLAKGSRILNIGCGTGSLDGPLSDLGYDITGIDVSERSLDRAKDANPGCNYKSFNGKEIPFPDQAFDLVLAVCVYHHIKPEDRSALVIDSLRVLKKNGTIAVIEHNPYNLLTRIAVARCEFDKDAQLITRSDSNDLLRDAGATDVRGEYFMTFPFSGKKAREIERYFSRIPIGAQYISYGKKQTDS